MSYSSLIHKLDKNRCVLQPTDSQYKTPSRITLPGKSLPHLPPRSAFSTNLTNGSNSPRLTNSPKSIPEKCISNEVCGYRKYIKTSSNQAKYLVGISSPQYL